MSRRLSWLAACSILALATASSAAAKPAAPRDLDRAQAIDAIREALLSAEGPAAPPPPSGTPTQLAQWPNWPNWGNWGNWNNWRNWGNWGNY